MDKRLIVAIISVCFGGLSMFAYPIRFGEIKKQVEINSNISESYKTDIARFDNNLDDMKSQMNNLLVELRELKAYLRAKEGKDLK